MMISIFSKNALKTDNSDMTKYKNLQKGNQRS